MLEQKTLYQIFDVLKNIKKHYISGEPLIKAYQKSVREVSTSNNPPVFYQTIADACTRRLGIKRDNFLDLVEEWLNGKNSKLIEKIKKYVFEYDRINKFFEEFSNEYKMDNIKKNSSLNNLETEILSFRINKKVSNKIEIVAKFKDKSIPEWLSENISKVVETEYMNCLVENMNENEKQRILKILQNEM